MINRGGWAVTSEFAQDVRVISFVFLSFTQRLKNHFLVSLNLKRNVNHDVSVFLLSQTTSHNANLSMQYITKFHRCKNVVFRCKLYYFSHFCSKH